MNKSQFKKEMRFQAMLFVLCQILASGIFSEHEYRQCVLMMVEKYQPVIGRIMV